MSARCDSARYLRDVAKADDTLCRLVTHHSCAVNEALNRNLFDAFTAEFDEERPERVNALTYCDMTTGPDDTHLDVSERLAEIHSRYGPEHLVSPSITASTPCILAAVKAVESAMISSHRVGSP
ncbi:phosphohydrolase [Nonomuraea sp. NPDC059194]|uniref:phosphohydrolase n=1 Tax=Nonomuraea sp. NPDC059194 TaxID=3346764 RepID=UPI0036C7DB93